MVTFYKRWSHFKNDGHILKYDDPFIYSKIYKNLTGFERFQNDDP